MPRIPPSQINKAKMLPLRLATQSYAWGVPAAQPSKVWDFCTMFVHASWFRVVCSICLTVILLPQVLDLARANGVEGTSGPEPDEVFAELW